LYCENKEDSIWHDLKNTSNNFLINTFNNSLKLIEQRYGATVFTELQIKKPETLKDIILRLDRLKFNSIDMDVIGGAFEYFLQQATATSNDLGEYFTPRHITKAIVNLVNPKFRETVYDPFCGTGGFLTESFSYVKENTIIDNEEDKKKLREETVYGNEITRNARLGKMNMILHGDGHSGVVQQNSLENPVDSKFDIVITNMPFAQKITRTSWNEDKKKNETVNNISPLYYNSLAKNSGDGVCLLHCFKSLKKGGRMALVVPEGVLFRQDLKNVRKFLLENAKLETVVSLPQGAFLPYTGVKTSILYFTNCHSAKTEGRVWYYEVKNDGFSLDNHRRAIKENDLKKIDYVDFLKKKYDEEDIRKIGFEAIEFEKIKNNSYNLCGNVYRESVRSSKYEVVVLSSILESIEAGTRPKGGITGEVTGAISLGGEQIGSNGSLQLTKIPFVSIEFYQDAKKGFVQDKDILICKDGALTGKVCLVDIKLLPQKEVMINEHVYVLRGKKGLIDQSYLFYCLYGIEVQNQIKNLAYNKTAQPGLNRQHLDVIQIPLPPLAEQKKIVDELDKIQKSIENANDLIKNLKAEGGGYWLDYGNEEFEIVRLGDIAIFEYGLTEVALDRGDYRFIRITDINDFGIISSNDIKYVNISKKGEKYILNKGDIVVARTGATYGKTAMFKENYKSVFASYLIRIKFKENDILPEYYYYFAQTYDYWKQAEKLVGGTGQPQFNANVIREIQIPIPSLEIQKEIVNKFAEEIDYIKQTEKVIANQKEKVKKIISKLWQDN
jgi:type I restriction enzyme M protein